MSGPDVTQNGAPPPPPQPTGSPFGRFLTQPVFLVALLALIVSAPIVALALKGDEGGNAAAEPAVLGDWTGPATDPSAEGPIDVELTIRSLRGGDDGTMTRRGCSGVLTYRGTTGGGYAFSYEEESDPRSCPRRSRVVVEPLGDDRLRFVERRRGRVVAEGVLNDAGS